MKFDANTLISPAARAKIKRAKPKAIKTPAAVYEIYNESKHNPKLPRRPGSEVAFRLPSLIAGERVYPRSI